LEYLLQTRLYPGTGLSSQNITWTVNNTTAAPVSCANVNILMSTDGGNTWPYTLASNTPNDGTQSVTIPNIPTTTARIKVESVGNIFFDISNSNFTITLGSPGFDFDFPAAATIACGGPSSASITLGTLSYLGYTTAINLSASGVPSGTSVSFGTNPVIPGNNTVVTLNNTSSLSAGTYTITITGVSGSITLTRDITFIIQAGSGPTITTQPASLAVCSGSDATFSVVATGAITGYQWQMSTDGGSSFSNISLATGPSYTVTGTLITQTSYRYRVIVYTQCGSTTSNEAILTVNNTPSVPILTPTAATICLGDVATLNASSTTTTTGTLGIGTSTTSGNTTGTALGPNPLQNYYGGNKQQMLFTATELSGLGMVAGTSISAIKLNLVTADATLPLQNLVVKMKNTATTTMAAWESGMLPVRAAANYTPSVGINTIMLNTPFIWDGINNLVIEINYSNADFGTTGSTFNTAKYSATTFVSTRFYRVDNASAATVDAYTGTPNATYSQRNDLTFEYTTTSNIAWSPLTGLYNEIGATTAYTGSNATTVYAKPATAGTFNYSATATGSNGCNSSSTATVTVNSCVLFTSLNLKVYLEGFYAGGGNMRATLYDLGLDTDPTATDSITVNLWSPANLSNQAPDHSVTALLHTNGTADLQFPAAVAGNSFYIAIRHRNSMETWSKLPVSFTGNTSYDFSNALSKAYDDGVNPPMASLGGSIFAMYGADVNQDGTVDASDMSDVDNDNAIFAFGYNITDASGDGATDASDISVVDNNQQLFLFYARPY
jgi:hypothetical protein